MVDIPGEDPGESLHKISDPCVPGAREAGKRDEHGAWSVQKELSLEFGADRICGVGPLQSRAPGRIELEPIRDPWRRGGGGAVGGGVTITTFTTAALSIYQADSVIKSNKN